MVMKTLRVAVIGLGKISKRVIEGIQYAEHATLYAVTSRDFNKAKKVKERYQCDVCYGSYEALCQDPLVDLIYICTPNPLHKQHILLCLSYHKHVICEKPMVANRKDLKECFSYAKEQGCFLMEAHKTLFTPLNQKIKQMVMDGVIGKLQYIEAGYCSRLDIEHSGMASWCFREEDGGCFYDIGVYAICYANFFAGQNLSEIKLMLEHAKEGYCVQAQGMLRYENDVMALVRSSWKTAIENKGYLYGEKGRIVCENFWKSKEAVLIQGDVNKKITVSMQSDFTGEIEHAISCIQKGLIQSPILGYEQSDQILMVLEESHLV